MWKVLGIWGIPGSSETGGDPIHYGEYGRRKLAASWVAKGRWVSKGRFGAGWAASRGFPGGFPKGWRVCLHQRSEASRIEVRTGP